MRRILGLLLILFSPVAGLRFAAQAPVHVVIVHTNDLHGHLLPRNGAGGIAEIAAIIRNARPDLILDAGDISTGTFLSDEFKGQPTIMAMNLIGYTSGTIGNHEFDYGQSALRAMLRQAKFPVLSANIETPIPEIQKYTIVAVRGVRFGIIGLTTESVTTTTDPRNLGGVRVHGIVETLRQLLPEVRRKSDFIILTVHLSDEEERSVAQAFPEIRLIVGGHNHAALGPIRIGSTLIAKAGSYGRNVGRIDLDFRDNRLSDMQAEVIPVRNTIPDPQVLKLLEPFNAEVQERMNEVIGEAAADLGGAPLANIVADAFRWKGRTQIAIENTGAIRAFFSRGRITWGNVFEVLPFEDTMVTLKLTGAQLKRTLEDRPGMLAVSGLRVQFDRNRPAGSRLVSATLLDGTPIEDSKLYSLTTNDFLVAGGDGVVEFGRGREIVDTGYSLREALVEYLKEHGILQPLTDDRVRFR